MHRSKPNILAGWQAMQLPMALSFSPAARR